MKETLNIGLFQYDILWENIAENKLKIERSIASFKEEIDLLILPETFLTGFTKNGPSYAIEHDNETLDWLRNMSVKYQTAICGSVYFKKDQNYTNRFLFVHPNGQIDHYDKRHLFSLGGEADQYTAGTQQTIINYLGWKISPTVCYDLRFPVWMRNKQLSYDLLINVANWPAKRNLAWTTLLAARAIENQCYSIGVNRVGKDQYGITYEGNSQAFNYLGEPLLKMENKEKIEKVALSYTSLKSYRDTFPFHADADDFSLL